ncbi:MAG: TolC family protein [Acidobacteriota bacterium]
MKRLLLIISLLASLGAVAGCTLYHPLPLDKASEKEALKQPDFKSVAVAASKIDHPLLQPVKVDLADGLSPDEAALVAVAANPQLRVDRDQRQLAAAQLIEAGLLPNPVLAYGQDIPTGGADQNTVTGYMTSLDLNLNALLTRGLRKKTAIEQQKAVNLQIAWREWQVAESAKLDVYQLEALTRQVLLARRMQEALGNNLKALQKAAREGEISDVRLAAAQAAFARGRDVLLNLEQQQETERRSLNAAMGFPPDVSIPLQGAGLPTWKSLPSQSAIMKGLDRRRLDLLALRKGYKSQELRVRLAVRNQFPNIGISINHGRDTSNIVSTGYAVSIDLPFFNRNQGRIAFQRATRKQLRDEYLGRLFDARAQIAQILGDMAKVKQKIEADGAALPADKRLAAAYEKALKDGSVDLISYNDAVNEVWTREIRIEGLKADLARLGVALELASGRYFPAGAAPAAKGAS